MSQNLPRKNFPLAPELCEQPRPYPTRREILGWSAVGFAAACGLPSGVDSFAAEDSAAIKEHRCTLGFSTYGMQKMEIDQALKALAEIGFDAVEMCVRTGWDSDSASLKPDRRRALRELLQSLSLRVTSLMEHVPPVDDKNQALALQRLKLAATLAHDLNPQSPPVIQSVLGGGDWEKTKTKLRDYLGEWVTLADQSQVTIAIKPHRGGALSQPAEAVWLLEQLGQPKRLRMVYDYSHYAFRDLPLDKTIETALPYTALVVLKDAVKEKESVVFKLPGEANTIDYVEILKQFYAGGYRGDFNCEVSGMVSGLPDYDPLAAAKISYANVAPAFEKAGVKRPIRS